MTRLRHVSVNQVEDREAPASISTRISFSIPRIESANLRMEGRRRGMSLEDGRSTEPKPDRSESHSAKHQTAVSQTTAHLQQTGSGALSAAPAVHVTAVTLAFLSRRAPFQEPLRVPRASVTLVIAHVTQEVCVTSSYGTTTLFRLSGAACFIYCCSFQP